jgi:methionyl-tRNA formyltransferase
LAKLSEKKLAPGNIFSSKSEIIVGCGTGAIEILELQQEGRKRMKSEEFLRGFSFN